MLLLLLLAVWFCYRTNKRQNGPKSRDRERSLMSPKEWIVPPSVAFLLAASNFLLLLLLFKNLSLKACVTYQRTWSHLSLFDVVDDDDDDVVFLFFRFIYSRLSFFSSSIAIGSRIFEAYLFASEPCALQQQQQQQSNLSAALPFTLLLTRTSHILHNRSNRIHAYTHTRTHFTNSVDVCWCE